MRERERIQSTEKITQKASISKKVADDAAVEVSVPERTTIPSGDDSVWADLSPLPESACEGSFLLVLTHFLSLAFHLCLFLEKVVIIYALLFVIFL